MNIKLVTKKNNIITVNEDIKIRCTEESDIINVTLLLQQKLGIKWAGAQMPDPKYLLESSNGVCYICPNISLANKLALYWSRSPKDDVIIDAKTLLSSTVKLK